MTNQAMQHQPNASQLPSAAAGSIAASALSGFDSSFLQLINAQRAAVGVSALQEVSGLDSMSGAWSAKMAAGGKYGKLTDNPDVAAQTLTSGASNRTIYTGITAKWYPQTVTVATALSLLTGNAPDKASLLNPAYHYIGLRTVVSADGTSFHSMTLTDKADAVKTASVLLGNLDHVRQLSRNLAISGWAADAAYASTPVTVTLKVTGPAGVSNTIVVPSNSRPDVVDFYATKGITLASDTGFSVLVPVQGSGNNTVSATVAPVDGKSAPRALAAVTINVV